MMFAIMFPDVGVTSVRFFIWVDQDMATSLASQDSLDRRDSFLLVGIRRIIQLNGLLEPAPGSLLMFIFEANPVKYLLFRVSGTT